VNNIFIIDTQLDNGKLNMEIKIKILKE